MVSMADKRAWLAGECRKVLNLHGAAMATLFGKTWLTVKLEQHIRRADVIESTRRDQLKIMDDPYWYCVLTETGPTIPRFRGNAREWVGGIHTFALVLLMKYHDADALADSSTPVWDRMIEGVEPAADIDATVDGPEGLLPYLRCLRYLPYAGHTVSVDSVTNDQKDVATMDEGATEVVHMLLVTVTVSDIT